MEPGAVIEVLARDGQVRSVHKITAWPCTLGRSPDCDLVLDDSHLAAVHARLEATEAGVRLSMLPSLNGGRVGSRRLASGDSLVLQAGTPLQVGATQLRLRLSSDALAPEQPLPERTGPHHKLALPVLLALWLALLWFDQWSALNPGSPWVDYSAAVLGPLAVLLAWAAAWALLSQLFQHRFPFLTHLWRALLGVGGLHLLSFALPLLAYAFSLPRLMALDALVFPLGMAAVLWWHAALVWPRLRRALLWALAGLLATALVLTVAKRQEQQHLFGPLYLSTLPPPGWRMVEPKPPEALIESLRPLEAELARKARKDDASADAAPEGE